MCCGAQVEIVNSEVNVLEEPATKRCPLSESLYGYPSIDREIVKKLSLIHI